MDAWAIGITVLGIILYFVTKRKPWTYLVIGFGAGLLAGAVWAAVIVQAALR